MTPEVGKSYSLFYNEGNLHNRKIHVRAQVDEVYFVIRHWHRYKAYWVYNIEHISWFECNASNLKKVK